MNKRTRTFVCLLPLLASGLFAPAQIVSNSFENGYSLGRGRVELLPSFTHYIAAAEGASAALGNSLGLRAGFGLGNYFDLKLRYERILPSENLFAETSLNFFSIIPKLTLPGTGAALQLPLGMYRSTFNDGFEFSSTTFSISPQIIKSFRGQKGVAEFTGLLKVDYLISGDEGGGSEFLMGLNVGGGFSSDLTSWSIRPEAGILFQPGETGIIWNMGIGFQITFSKQQKQ